MNCLFVVMLAMLMVCFTYVYEMASPLFDVLMVVLGYIVVLVGTLVLCCWCLFCLSEFPFMVFGRFYDCSVGVGFVW